MLQVYFLFHFKLGSAKSNIIYDTSALEFLQYKEIHNKANILLSDDSLCMLVLSAMKEETQ